MTPQPPAQDFVRANDPAVLRALGIAVGMTEAEREEFIEKISATVPRHPRRKLPGIPQSERDLQTECATWLREHSGIPCYFVLPRTDKRSGLPVGHPDFSIWTTNRFGRPIAVLIECKRADVADLDPEQKRVAAELAAVGHVVHVARSLAEFRQAIKEEVER